MSRSEILHWLGYGLDEKETNLLAAISATLETKFFPASASLNTMGGNAEGIGNKLDTLEARLNRLENNGRNASAASAPGPVASLASAITAATFVPPRRRRTICYGGFGYNEGEVWADD